MCSADEEKRPSQQPLNVLGSELEICSRSPMTGWFRDGTCRTDARDRGVHVVCAEMNEAFLTYTKSRGNDLSTPRPGGSFPGLVPGDRWCLCATRWAEAERAGYAPSVVLDATDDRALDFVEVGVLTNRAISNIGSLGD